MERIEKIIEFLATVLLVLVGLLGLLISILDFIGTDFTNGPWKWLKGPTPVTLMTVAVLALALGLERIVRFRQINQQFNKIESLLTEGPDRIIQSLDGVNIRRLNNAPELYGYVVKRMREAKRTIDDLTWGTAEREITPAGDAAFKKYVETIPVVCSKKSIAYREVMSFSPYDRLKHLDRAEAMLNKDIFGYRLRYYELSTEGLPPLLLFMVIDSEEVIIASWGSPFFHLEQEVQLAIRQPDIVKIFQDYYNVIWQGAKILKDGDRVERDAIREIRKRLDSKEDLTPPKVT